MPIISPIGRRSLKVRLVIGSIYTLLIAGGITMIYPLLLMLTKSVASQTDITQMAPFPRYWTDNGSLFQKYVESKYAVDVMEVSRAWNARVTDWLAIEPPTENQSPFLADYLAWRSECPDWWLGNAGPKPGNQDLPAVNSRLFRDAMFEQFHGDIEAYASAMGLGVQNWNAIRPPWIPVGRYRPPTEGLTGAFVKFARSRPVSDRIVPNLDGYFWFDYLCPKYGPDITAYNKVHGTQYRSQSEVFLARRAPAQAVERQDWEEYVRRDLPLAWIRIHPDLVQAPMPDAAPCGRLEQVDWEAKLKDPSIVPLDAIEVLGPRQLFEEFVAQRRGVAVASLEPLPVPVAAADYRDTIVQAGALRWEFAIRNYRYVLSYLAGHGHGILNTIIYCSLAIATALLVNPLAAYALSRFRLPSTFAILLFCMATMAFPGEVTMIPSFLLLKRFPLWPIIAGLGVFLLVFYLISKFLPRFPEGLLLIAAILAGSVMAAWWAPLITGKAHISLLNTFSALVLPHMANGFSIFLLKGFFDSLPRELYEAAEIDGAGEWTKFWTITMNTSTPILAVIALSAFNQAYSAFMMALVIIPDQNMWTIMVWIFQLQAISHPGVVFASLVLAAVPTFFIFVLCQNMIMRGIVVPQEK